MTLLTDLELGESVAKQRSCARMKGATLPEVGGLMQCILVSDTGSIPPVELLTAPRLIREAELKPISIPRNTSSLGRWLLLGLQRGSATLQAHSFQKDEPDSCVQPSCRGHLQRK